MKSARVILNFGTRTPRDEAILALQELTQKSDFSILDCRIFSNISLVLELEGTTSGLLSLCSALLNISFKIEAASQDQLTQLKRENSDSLVLGTIQVTFATGDGSLVTPVPMVPG